MAIIDRYTLDELVDQIRREVGEKTATGHTRSPDTTAANDWGLYSIVNAYVENFASRCASVAAPGRKLLFPCWYEEEQTVTTSSGSNDAYLPNNCFHPIRLWDNTSEREVDLIFGGNPLTMRLRNLKTTGPPRHAIVVGMATSTTWRYKLRLRPNTASGITPSLVVDQYRVPAKMDETSASTEKPDIDPKYQQAIVLGCAADWLMPHHPRYPVFRQQEERELAKIAADAVIARMAA